jgi:hypothetical protein
MSQTRELVPDRGQDRALPMDDTLDESVVELEKNRFVLDHPDRASKCSGCGGGSG